MFIYIATTLPPQQTYRTHSPKLRLLLVFTNIIGKNSRYFVGVFNKTIIPLALVGYEMIIANSYPTRTRGIVVKYMHYTAGTKVYCSPFFQYFIITFS